jgi:lysophospholipase L1-like esterase
VQTEEKQIPETPTVDEPIKTKVPKRIPAWAAFSVAANGLLLLSISLLYWKPELMRSGPLEEPAPQESVRPAPETPPPLSQYTYEQWIEILTKESAATAKTNPPRLTVLLGDSLSLWFPTDMLPGDRTWLNQGISGESAVGVVKRLNLLDNLQPETILLMVGVNDLIKGAPEEQILENYRQILKTLKEKHPKSAIVVQSLLPHGGDRIATVDREQVLKLSNERIHQFNQKLAALTSESEVHFLNLHPIFTDSDGLLREDLSTDGLHLKREGYFAWRSAFQVFAQLLLPKPVEKVVDKTTAPEPLPIEPPVEKSPESAPAAETAPADKPQ